MAHKETAARKIMRPFGMGDTGPSGDSVTSSPINGYKRAATKHRPSDAIDDAISPDLVRLAELWPVLDDDARGTILSFAEKSVMLPATD